jgi:hypothetical protein
MAMPAKCFARPTHFSIRLLRKIARALSAGRLLNRISARTRNSIERKKPITVKLYEWSAGRTAPGRNRKATMARKNNIIKMKNTKNETERHRRQSFFFSAPTAMSVQLVGDFTQWQEKPVNMQKDADGIWRTTIELPPGMHHYRFLVDGQWRDDPECAVRVPNPFGGQDAIRQVA